MCRQKDCDDFIGDGKEKVLDYHTKVSSRTFSTGPLVHY